METMNEHFNTQIEEPIKIRSGSAIKPKQLNN